MTKKRKSPSLTDPSPTKVTKGSCRATRKRKESMEHRAAVDHLKHAAAMRAISEFTMGETMNYVQDNRWYESEGYKDFDSFVENIVGVPKSTAHHWMRIVETMAQLRIDAKIGSEIGLTKLRLVAPYLTEDNRDEWLNIARQLTLGQLRGRIGYERHRAKQRDRWGPSKLIADDALTLGIDPADDEPWDDEAMDALSKDIAEPQV
jgi:hypothetical protein